MRRCYVKGFVHVVNFAIANFEQVLVQGLAHTFVTE